MPKKIKDPSAVAISRSVTNALGQVSAQSRLKRPPLAQLRATVVSSRGEYHKRLTGGASLNELHRALVAQLKIEGYRPISYNTLKAWLAPLPTQ